MRSTPIEEMYAEHSKGAYDVEDELFHYGKYYPELVGMAPLEAGDIARYTVDHHPEEAKKIIGDKEFTYVNLLEAMGTDGKADMDLYRAHTEEYDFRSYVDYMIQEGLYYSSDPSKIVWPIKTVWNEEDQ